MRPYPAHRGALRGVTRGVGQMLALCTHLHGGGGGGLPAPRALLLLPLRPDR